MTTATHQREQHKWTTLAEAEERIRMCNSYSRLPAVLDLEMEMEHASWLQLLGREWSGFDNVSQFQDDLVGSTMVPDTGFEVMHQMMTAEESAAYDALPDSVMIYRGCYRANKWGLCWSTSRDVAEEFPTLPRYRRAGQHALIVEATVGKARIIAVKLGRGEEEIVCHQPRVLSTKRIGADALKAASIRREQKWSAGLEELIETAPESR